MKESSSRTAHIQFHFSRHHEHYRISRVSCNRKEVLFIFIVIIQELADETKVTHKIGQSPAVVAAQTPAF